MFSIDLDVLNKLDLPPLNYNNFLVFLFYFVVLVFFPYRMYSNLTVKSFIFTRLLREWWSKMDTNPMFAVHLLLLVSLSCLVSRFGRLQLRFPHFESDEPVQNYSLLLDMPNILQIIRSFKKKVILVYLLWTHP